MFWVGLGIGVVIGANLGVIMISLFKINKH